MFISDSLTNIKPLATQAKDMLTAVKARPNATQYKVKTQMSKGRTQAASKKPQPLKIWQRFLEHLRVRAHTPPGLDCMLSTQKQNLQT